MIYISIEIAIDPRARTKTINIVLDKRQKFNKNNFTWRELNKRAG